LERGKINQVGKFERGNIGSWGIFQDWEIQVV
jgi:hypothetical protein